MAQGFEKRTPNQFLRDLKLRSYVRAQQVVCPNCRNADSFVMRTEAIAGGVKRRRECCRCHQRWNTYETAENVIDELAKLKRALAPVAELVK